MARTPAIRLANVGKCFRLFASRRDRLLEAVHPLRKRYHDPFWALNEVSCEIPAGQSVGIIGRNGSGKSTLLQIIAGVMQPSAGAIAVAGRVAALLQLGAGFNPEFSGRENALLNGVLMGVAEEEMRQRMPEIESFAELGRFFDQPVGTYSSGMFLRLGFAVAMSVRAGILVVDEAIAVGDAAFRYRCFERIREFRAAGGTLLLVSHEREQLLGHCERGLLLDQGRVIMDASIHETLNHYDRMRFDPAIGQAAAAQEAAERVPGLETCPQYSPGHFRAGDGRALLVDLKLLDHSGAPVARILPGQRLHLHATYQAQSRVEAAQFGFAICTADGVTLYGQTGYRLGTAPVALAAGSRAAIEYSFDLPLLTGEYFINLGLYELLQGEPAYIDTRRGVLRLDIVRDDRVAGMVDVNCTTRLHRLPACGTS